MRKEIGHPYTTESEQKFFKDLISKGLISEETNKADFARLNPDNYPTFEIGEGIINSEAIMKYDFRNNPTIEDEYHSKFVVSQKDLYDDCGDCVHVKHPETKEEWRFYYEVENDIRVLDSYGVIQL